MHLVGRYHRVRPFGASGVGPPYVWDRGRAQDAPRMIPAPYDKGERFKGFTRYGEWWRSPEGLWTPAVRGGAGGVYMSGGRETPRMRLTGSASGSAAQGTLALDSNYVNATGGDAIAHRFVVPVGETLQKVYYFITAYTGTAANVNDISLELRNNNSSTGPSSTLHDSVIHDPASVTSWLATSGWTFTLVSGTLYWLVVGDADGNGTDFATVLRSTGRTSQVADYSMGNAVQTTDGWVSVRTITNQLSNIILLFDSGRIQGDPISASAASTSSTNQRGLRFVAPVTCAVFGMVSTNAELAALSGVGLWSGSNGPSGSPDGGTGTIALPGTTVGGVDRGFAFGTMPTLQQGVAYRIVFTYASAGTQPLRYQIGTGADAALRSAMLGGGAWYWAEANGTTNWNNDNTSEFPAVDVILEDFVTVAQGIGLTVSDGLRKGS